MRTIKTEKQREGVTYPIVTDEEIIVTPEIMHLVATKKLCFKPDLSGVADYAKSGRQTLREEKAKLQKTVSALEKWFVLYDRQIAEYNRCVRLSENYDEKYGSVRLLDANAEEKAAALSAAKKRLAETEAQISAQNKRLQSKGGEN